MRYMNEFDQAYGYDVIHSSAESGSSRVLLADGDALLRRRMAQALRSDGHARPKKAASNTLTKSGAKARKQMTVSTLLRLSDFMLQ